MATTQFRKVSLDEIIIKTKTILISILMNKGEYNLNNAERFTTDKLTKKYNI